MVATCQFCRQMIVGPESRIVGDLPGAAEAQAFAYRQLSLLVSAHMSERHAEEVGRAVMGAMALAGAAVAMRFVTSSDAALDAQREAAGWALADQFTPKPEGPLVSLAA